LGIYWLWGFFSANIIHMCKDDLCRMIFRKKSSTFSFKYFNLIVFMLILHKIQTFIFYKYPLRQTVTVLPIFWTLVSHCGICSAMVWTISEGHRTNPDSTKTSLKCQSFLFCICAVQVLLHSLAVQDTWVVKKKRDKAHSHLFIKMLKTKANKWIWTDANFGANFYHCSYLLLR
jgi:hypothetical protein